MHSGLEIWWKVWACVIVVAITAVAALRLPTSIVEPPPHSRFHSLRFLLDDNGGILSAWGGTAFGPDIRLASGSDSLERFAGDDDLYVQAFARLLSGEADRHGLRKLR